MGGRGDFVRLRTENHSTESDFSFGAEIFSVLLRQILCCYLIENQEYERWPVFLLFTGLDERKKIDTDSTPVHRLYGCSVFFYL